MRHWVLVSMADAVLVGLASKKLIKTTENVVGSELWRMAHQ